MAPQYTVQSQVCRSPSAVIFGEKEEGLFVSLEVEVGLKQLNHALAGRFFVRAGDMDRYDFAAFDA